MARSEPLIVLLWAVQELRAVHPSQHGVSLEELAEACEVSTRTVRRKLRALEDAGFHLLKTRDGTGKPRYRLDAKTLAIVGERFDVDEITALCVASTILRDIHGLEVGTKIASVFQKVVRSVPPLLRQKALKRAHVVATDGTSATLCEKDAAIVTDLVTAIGERWPVQITRRVGKDNGRASMRFDPHVLHCVDGTLCVIGRAHPNDKLCALAVKHIEELYALRDETFTPLWYCGD